MAIREGLINYFHYKQGFSTNKWTDIAPSAIQSNVTTENLTLADDGIIFDSSSDFLVIEKNDTNPINEITLEIGMILSGLRIDGREEKLFEIYDSTLTKVIRLILSDDENITYNYLDALNGKEDTIVVKSNINIGSLFTLTFQFKNSNNGFGDLNIFVNNLLIITRNNFRSLSNFKYLVMEPARLRKLKFIRSYNRILSSAELRTNYDVSYDNPIISDTVIVATPPKVISIVTDNTKISGVNGKDRAIISFSFDKDITEYVARVLGVSYDTGTLAHRTIINATSGTILTAEVDYTELYQEGINRVNIYGKGTDGKWTVYDS